MIELGTRFGMWTVIGRAQEDRKKGKKGAISERYRVMCRCDCGTERSVTCHSLLKKGVKSCGCRGRRTHKVKPGDRYGRWVVINEADRRDGRRYMKCRCDCGWLSDGVKLEDLVSGKSSSCGCYNVEISRARKGLKKIKLDSGKLVHSWSKLGKEFLNGNR